MDLAQRPRKEPASSQKEEAIRVDQGVLPKGYPKVSRYTSPDFLSAALMTIDMQQDTLDGQPLEVPGTSAILPTLKQILHCFREAGKPIVHMVRIYKLDGSNVDLCRREQIEQGAPYLIEGTAGCEIAPELLTHPAPHLNTEELLAGSPQSIGPNEVVIYKPRWGAFYQTPLEAYLRRQHISTLCFTGCNFPNCPRTSIYEANERDFQVLVIEDAISGFYERGKVELRNIGVSLEKADALCSHMTHIAQT